MPRARNIKPGFFTNDELVELPMATRLLFIGLWTLADREGRLEDRPRKIKMELFPADDVNVDEALSTLVSSAAHQGKPGFIQRYTVDGIGYIQINNFTKHQRPHSNESESVIPPPPAGHVSPPPKNPRQIKENEPTANQGEQDGEPGKKALSPSRARVTDSLNTDTGYRIPETGLPEPEGPATPAEEPPSPPIPVTPSPKPLQPFDLLEALLETLGQELSILTPSEKSKQLGVAKRLLADGMTDADVRDMAKWLQAQTWMTSGIDFLTLEKYRGRWQMSGKPTAIPNGALSVYAGGRSSYNGRRDFTPAGDRNLSNDELEAMMRGEELA